MSLLTPIVILQFLQSILYLTSISGAAVEAQLLHAHPTRLHRPSARDQIVQRSLLHFPGRVGPSRALPHLRSSKAIHQ